MGVYTTADERLDSAASHIKDAIKDLSTIVIDECWGFDEYNSSYKDEIYDAMQKLIALKKQLGRD